MVKKTLSFKKLIINELAAHKENKYVSRIKILKNISKKLKNKHSQKRLRSFINRALDTLVSKDEATRKKHSFKLSKKIFQRLLQKAKNAKKIKNKNKNLNKPVKKISYKSQSTNKQRIKVLTKTAKNKSNPATQLMITPLLPTSLLSIVPHMNLQTTYSTQQKYKKRHPAIWQYYDNNNFNAKIIRSDGWYDYDQEASDIVEDEWQRYITNRGMNDVRSVKSGQWEYMVDFINWTQTNIVHQNHTIRQIRRIDDKGEVTKNPYLNC